MLVALISAWMIIVSQSGPTTRPAPHISINDLEPRLRSVSQTVTTSTQCPRILVEIAVKDKSVDYIKIDNRSDLTLLEFAKERYSPGRVADVEVGCSFEGAYISLFTERGELILTIPVRK